jgi:hypothetical protein
MMKRVVLPKTYGRGICLPQSTSIKKKEDDEDMTYHVPTSNKSGLEELKHVVQEKGANENLIKKLAGMRLKKRKITFVP